MNGEINIKEFVNVILPRCTVLEVDFDQCAAPDVVMRDFVRNQQFCIKTQKVRCAYIILQLWDGNCPKMDADTRGIS